MANKLQAVNEVLQRLGKLPTKTRDPGGTSTHAIVERCLNNASDMVQGQGWAWNTKTNKDVTANADSNLQVNNLEIGTVLGGTGTITQQNPCEVSLNNHGLETGNEVYIENPSGMTEIDKRVFTVTVLSEHIFELDGEDATNHTAGGFGSGTIHKSQHIYHVDTVGSDADKNYSRRGAIMYNENDQTFTITGSTKMGWIYQFDFEDVPDSFQKWIISLAAYDFNRYYIGDRAHDQMLEAEIADTKRQATREEIRAVDVDVLDQQPMRQIRGRRRMPDRSTY